MAVRKSLLIMAAGSGSRYGGLKQFDALGLSGEYLMEFAIYDAIDAGFSHIVLVTKATYVEELTNYMAQRLPEGISLDVLAQELGDIPSGICLPEGRVKPWGTAHAVWTARQYIDNPFAVINADDFYGPRAYHRAAAAMDASGNSFGMLGYRLGETLSDFGTVSRGICTVENGELRAIVEATQLEKSAEAIIDRVTEKTYGADSLVSMNFWICQPAIFGYIARAFRNFLLAGTPLEKGELYLPLVVQEYCAQEGVPIAVWDSGARWFGVTYAADKDMAKSSLSQMQNNKIYPAALWKRF
ncbi:MAG: sugar phosphate nucleotidyltransferase [Flavobacteriaceae bacterium]|nr:sugar phosphate nucleotidyltransferase [Flavobacteriaceae bacterium]